MSAATFQAAAGVASMAVQGIYQGVTLLRTSLQAWLTAIAALDPASVPQRTVLDWVAPGMELLGSLPTTKGGATGETQAMANITSILIWRTCKAIEYAGYSSRISTAQKTALLAAFNAAWPN